MFLLDTNTVIYYLKASLPTNAMQVLGNIIDDQPAISVISKIELLCFNTPNINEQNITNKFVEASLIFNLDDDIINQTIALRKQYKIKLPDGNTTSYYYTNGICSKVKVEQSLFTIEFVLTQKTS